MPGSTKEYMKEYYQKQKAKRIAENKQVITCKLCDRKISAENFLTHTKSKICEKHYNRKLELLKKLKELKENEIINI